MATDSIKITEHAYTRAKERLGWNQKALDRMAAKAFKEGITHGQTKSRLNKYITKLYFEYNCQANNIKIHGQIIFFFAGSTLITLYRVPNELLKQIEICKEEKQ